MNYRPGTLQDLDAICELVSKAVDTMISQGIFQWDELYPTREDFEQDITKNTLYVAEHNNQIAAIYVLSQECDEEYQLIKWNGEDEKACVLHRLCVSPDFQHQGIGNQVLNHLEKQLSDSGFETVRLDAFTQNPFALKLYRKNGYAERGFADWRKGRFVLMEKKL